MESIEDIKKLWDSTPIHWKKILLMNLYHYEEIKENWEYEAKITELYKNTPDNFIETDDIHKLIKIEKILCKNFPEITDYTFEFPEIIKYFPNLERLGFNNNQIEGISVLENLTNLEVLKLWDNPISEKKIEKLRKKLPNTDIHF